MELRRGRGRSKSPARGAKSPRSKSRGRSKSPAASRPVLPKKPRSIAHPDDPNISSEAKWAFKQDPLSRLFQSIIGPLLLMVPCPIICLTLAFITTDLVTKFGKTPSLGDFYEHCSSRGVSVCAADVLDGGRLYGDSSAWFFLIAFNYVALLIYWWPGKLEYGPLTAGGHRPEYMDNGVAHCLLFTVSFLAGSTQVGQYVGYAGWYSLSVIYDTYSGSIGALNIFGLGFCVFLYLKGRYFPSGPDHGLSGTGPIFDYYWGTELYPRVCNVDVKKFVNCRFSMTYWMLAGISFTAKSYELHGHVDPGVVLAALSQFLYLCKFYWWEIGYMRSIDIIVDRAGFYETWGCLVWVPSVYTLHTRILVQSTSGLSWPVALLIFGVGLSGVFLNFWADDQRQQFRAKNGECLVWGKPPQFVRCTYTAPDPKTGAMKTHNSLLLASGWWGMARHLQYLFELTAAWSWSLLGGVGKNGLLPLFYAAFLTILLVDRAKRDQDKCLAKYGDGYRRYMEMVPYKIIPGIF